MLDDILHVLPTILHSPHQVEQRIVAQLEGTQQGGWLACHNLSAAQPSKVVPAGGKAQPEEDTD